MGRTGSGVEVRAKSIRFTFLPGRPTWMLDGQPVSPTPANEKRALRLAAEIRERIKYGTFSLGEYFPASGTAVGGPALSDQLDAWLGTLRLADSTKASYRSVIKFWKTARFSDRPTLLGDMPLRSLKPSHVRGAIARTTLSGKTINNRMSVLREALQSAVDDGLLLSNPVKPIASATWQRQPVDPFTAEEVELILADMAKRHPSQVANYTAAKFFTGLRTGESFGLRWPNVDLASGHMVVRESVVGGKQKDSTKTSVARTVFLNSRALSAIAAQRAHTFIAGEHVFHDPRDGARWGGEPKFRWYWVPTLKRLGIRHRPPYNTRHTYATMMLMAGMTPAFCAGQMGHSVEMFLRTYAKWIPGAGDAAEMAKLERSLKTTGT